MNPVVPEHPAYDLGQVGGAEDGVAGRAVPRTLRQPGEEGVRLLARGDEVLQRLRAGLRWVVALDRPRVGVRAGDERVVRLHQSAQAGEVHFGFHVAQVADDLCH